MPQPALVSVACTLQFTAPDVAALPHVLLSVSMFLDVSVLLSLKKAAASGSLRLFRRVLTRLQESTPPIDEFLMASYLSMSMAAAVEHGHLAIAQSIHAIHPGRLFCPLLSSAARNGEMTMVQWLSENRRDDLCCVPLQDERDPNIEVLEDPPRCCLSATFESALTAKQFAVIKWLIEHGYQWPDSYYPHRFAKRAASSGDLDTIKWLHERNEPDTFGTGAIDGAAKQGHTEVVAFLLMNRPEGYSFRSLVCATSRDDDKMLELLQSPTHQHLRSRESPTRNQWVQSYASSGRFDLVLRELQSLEHPIESLGAVKGFLFIYAIKHDNLHFLRWVHEHDRDGFKSVVVLLLNVAAVVWRLKIVQWFHQHYSGVFTTEVMDKAAKEGHLELIKWLHFNRTDGCSQDAMDGAANAGHLELVQWLHEHRTEGCTARAMDRAAQNGRHDVVKWLHYNRTEGCTTQAMDGAATKGDLELVIWLHQHRSEGCTTAAMDGAAANGDLEMVKWLHQHRMEGCTTRAMDGAASNGHHDVVRWLHEHRTEGCTAAAMDSAAARGDLELVIWLHEHWSEGCTTQAMDGAPLYVVKWLHFNRTEGCTTDAMDNAAREGDLAKLQFLHKYRTEGCTAQAAADAAKEGHLYILQWFHRHHPQNFDLARVSNSARTVPHIRSWLDSTQ